MLDVDAQNSGLLTSVCAAGKADPAAVRAAAADLLLLWAQYTAAAISKRTRIRANAAAEEAAEAAEEAAADAAETARSGRGRSRVEEEEEEEEEKDEWLLWQRDSFPMSADLYVAVQRACSGRGLDHSVKVNPSLDFLMIPT